MEQVPADQVELFTLIRLEDEMGIPNENPITEPATDEIVWDRLFVVSLEVNGWTRTEDDTRQNVHVKAELKPSRLDGQTERVHQTAPSIIVKVKDVLGAIAGESGDYSPETRQQLGVAFQAIIEAVSAVQGEQ